MATLFTECALNESEKKNCANSQKNWNVPKDPRCLNGCELRIKWATES